MGSSDSGAWAGVKRWVARGAKLTVTAAAAYLALRRIDTAELWLALKSVAVMPALAAFGLYLAGQLLTAWRWHLITAAVGFTQSFGRSATFYFVGMFFNHVGPSTLGGDLVRGLYLGGAGGRRRRAVATVALDRIVGLAALLIIATAAVTLSDSVALPEAVVLVTVAATAAMLLGWVAITSVAGSTLVVGGAFSRFADSEIGVVARDQAMLGRLIAISMVFHGIQIIAAMAVGRAVGLEVEPFYYLVFHPLVAVLAALPVSMAGLGVRELGYVYFLADLAATPQHTAVAFAMVWLAVVLGSSAVGGLVFWLSGLGLPVLRDSPSSLARAQPSCESSQFPPSS